MISLAGAATCAVILLVLCAGSFLLGMNIANKYNAEERSHTKDALERQYMRLRANADSDDPVRPYKRRVQQHEPTFEQAPATLTPKQWLPESFANELKETGKAKIAFRKSDVG